jgi:O-acetyl-ADP-ribose deacetylase (regulator of RNase III)
MEYIKRIKGNIFNSNCDAIVNTVNCKGFMGKGLALEFKYRYPEMFLDYKKRVEKSEIKIGKLTLWDEKNIKIINFPTKFDWKYPSKIDYIKEGLDFFKAHYKSWGITSVAFPGLGTDQGGLDFREVANLIKDSLGGENILVELYEYDPNSKDLLFEKLRGKIKDWDLNNFKGEGISRKYALRIIETLKSEKINNFGKVLKIDGIGESTIKKLYLLAKQNKGTLQKKLF